MEILIYLPLGLSSVEAAVATGCLLALSSCTASNILPGFISQCGSRARLIFCITLIVSNPSSSIKLSFFPSPMPCSPVQVPSCLVKSSGKDLDRKERSTYHLQCSVHHTVHSVLYFFALVLVLAIVENGCMEVTVAYMAENTGKEAEVINLFLCDFCHTSG